MLNPTNKRPLILAHRGDSAYAPENSLPAFEQAISKGADGVEMDLWQCASGEIVVCHDQNLARLTGQAGDLKVLSYQQLSQYTLAPQVKIPLLTEVLDVVGGLKLINLEIKDTELSRPRAVGAFINLLKTHRIFDKVVVSSFNPLVLYRLKHLAPKLRLGLLFQKKSALPLRRAWASKILKPFSLHPDKSLLSPKLVNAAHQRGQKVIAWTVNEGDDLARCLSLGVDSIITDDPAWLKQALK